MIHGWLGRPVEVDSDQIETLTENNQHYTMWEIADILKISNISVESHLHDLGYVNHFEVWVQHKWKKKPPKTFLDCITAYNSLLKYKEYVPFLKQIVTDNEKWILYNNMEQTRSWDKWSLAPTTPKDGLYPKKVMLFT